MINKGDIGESMQDSIADLDRKVKEAIIQMADSMQEINDHLEAIERILEQLIPGNKRAIDV